MKDDLELLIARYLDGSAQDEDVRRLDARLRRDPDARRELLLAAEQDVALRDWAPKRAPSPAARLWAAAGILAAAVGLVLLLPSRKQPEAAPAPKEIAVLKESPTAPEAPPLPTPAPVFEAPVETEAPPVEATPPPTPLPKLPAPAFVRAAPAVEPGKTEAGAAAVGILERSEGDVRIVVDEVRRPAERGQRILAGQGIETAGGSAQLKVGDDLSLDLAPNTRLAGVGPEIGLLKGSVKADSARSKFAVVTPRGRAEAAGAKLAVKVSPASTWLEVDRGSARLVRREDGAFVDVAAGHGAALASNLPFQAQPLSGAVDPVRVDQAIAKGLEFLKAAKLPAADLKRSKELVLWTYVHAGVSDRDPQFKRLLDAVLTEPLEKTYDVALQAMLLEEIDRVKHQGRILQCAQFLVDNQCRNGQWSYGEPTIFAEDVPTGGEAARDVATAPARKVIDFSEPKQKPKVVRKVPIKKQKDGPATGDNSNSQYAALGLRACHDAGAVLPREVVERAKDWWIKCQGPDEAADNGYGGVRGWGYQKPGPKDDPDDDKDGQLGSMTAGAVGSLVICDYILGLDWKKTPALKSGMNWLASHFTVTDNPGGKPWRHYYYLYGLERAGILYGTEKIGPKLWYAEGANFLLADQEANGSWKIEAEIARSKPVWDTCFAILFLRRATRPLQDVASVDAMKSK